MYPGDTSFGDHLWTAAFGDLNLTASDICVLITDTTKERGRTLSMHRLLKREVERLGELELLSC
jgi:hypothetical protein